MSRVSILSEDAFDGERWLGPVRIVVEDDTIAEVESVVDARADGDSVALVTPGLVDFGVSACGYADATRPTEPFAAESAFAIMCLRWGVTSVVDLNNSIQVLRHLSTNARAGRGPRIAFAGGRLVSEPSCRNDLTVTLADVSGTIRAQLALGATVVSVGRVDVSLGRIVSDEVRRTGVPLVGTRYRRCDTPGIVVIPEVRSDSGSADFDALLETEGAQYVPQLEASARWTVDGLLQASDAALAAPFLPYSRNFARNKGVLGRRIARDVLGRYYGHRDPGDLDDSREERALRHLAAGTCLASSGVGAAGLIPGLSLWAELSRLSQALDVSAALRAATASPADVLPGLHVGKLAPGYAADILLYGGVRRDSNIDSLRGGLVSIMVAGVTHAVSDLSTSTDRLVHDALKEPL